MKLTSRKTPRKLLRRRQTPNNAAASRRANLWRQDDELESIHASLLCGPPLPMSRDLVSFRYASQSAAARRCLRRNTVAAQYQTTAAKQDEESWEASPGTVTARVITWTPQQEACNPGDNKNQPVADKIVAVSASAFGAAPIRDSCVCLTKALDTLFLGAGVLDLPPGSKKLRDNSRNMHMMFVVQLGKPLITINRVQFHISAGGMWFVPRGNSYSIANEGDGPCRLYFSQACETAIEDPTHEPDAETASDWAKSSGFCDW